MSEYKRIKQKQDEFKESFYSFELMMKSNHPDKTDFEIFQKWCINQFAHIDYILSELMD